MNAPVDRGHHGAPAVSEVAQERDDALLVAAVQPRCGLVAEQAARIVHQFHGDGEPFFLAAADAGAKGVANVNVSARGQTHALEQGVHAAGGGHSRGGRQSHLRVPRQCLPQAEHVEHDVLLGHQVGVVLQVRVVNRRPIEEHGAPEHAVAAARQDGQQRRLAAAALADARVHGARVKCRLDVTEDLGRDLAGRCCLLHHIKKCEPGRSASHSTPAVERTMIGLYVAGQAHGRRRLRVVESEQTQRMHHSSSISRTAATLSALSRSSSSLPGELTSPASTSRTGAAASPSNVSPPPTGPSPSTTARPTAAVAAYMAPELLSQRVRGGGHTAEEKVLRRGRTLCTGVCPSDALMPTRAPRHRAPRPAPHSLGEGLEARSRRMECPATV